MAGETRGLRGLQETVRARACPLQTEEVEVCHAFRGYVEFSSPTEDRISVG